MSLNPLRVTNDFTSELISRVLSERIESDFLLFGCDCIHSVYVSSFCVYCVRECMDV